MDVRLNSPIFFEKTDRYEGVSLQTRVTKMLIILFFILVFVTFFVRKGKGINGSDPNMRLKTQDQKPLSINPDPGTIPLYFIPNTGQVNKDVLFYARASRYTLWMTKDGLIFDSTRALSAEHSAIPGEVERDVSRLIFQNINKNPRIIPLDITKHKVNYFKSKNRSTWKLNISTARAVLYENIYNNIDLKVYGKTKKVEYDWIIKPGGNPADIRFTYRDVKSTMIDAAGNLVIETGFGELVHKKPDSYQDNSPGGEAFPHREFILISENEPECVARTVRSTGHSEPIPGSAPGDRFLRQKENSESIDVRFKRIGKNTYGFDVGAYDKHYTLTIDPLVQLDYSTYLGGSEDDFGQDIAVDKDGNVYITGFTNSLNFPVRNPFQKKYGGGSTWRTERDVFITKLSSDGSAFGYSTYLGGNNIDEGKSIAVDNKGCVYITGTTKSSDFPTKYPIQGTFAGDQDLFITKLSAQGSSIVYSTFFGGINYEVGEGIAVDSKGCAYVTGCTDSPDFPTKNSFLSIYGGGCCDAFAAKFSPAGTSLLFSTFIGGDGTDSGKSIAVDSRGCSFITGHTNSIDFPVKNPFQWTFAGGKDFESSDAFAAKLSDTGDALLFSTYLGGNGSDSGEDIAIDNKGCAYVTGMTASSDFPLKNPCQGAPVSCINEVVFITKFSPTGNTLIYSTYLGGVVESGCGIAVDKAGSAYITGNTWSSDFPVKNPFQERLSGQCDAFVTKLSPHGSTLSFSTYLGGSSFDQARGIAVDDSGDAYITGYSSSTNFPMKNPIRGKNIKYNEAFITKLSAQKR